MKNLKFITLLLTLVFISCNTCRVNNKNYSLEKLYGEWFYVNQYDGIIKSIDTLTRTSSSKTSVTYKRNGTTFSNHGDYFESSKFTLDSKSGIITEICKFNTKDTIIFSRIKYLDDSYLLLLVNENTSQGPTTFFYKKKIKTHANSRLAQ